MKRKLSLILAAIVLASALGACSSTTTSSSASTSSSSGGGGGTSSSGIPSSSTPTATGSVTYPLPGNPKIKIWDGLSAEAAAGGVKTLAETPLYKEVMKQTGVDIEFVHPPAGQGNEPFNLMIASGDHPDLMYHQWLTYPGGPEAAFKNKILVPLNDKMDEWTPDLAAYLKANPDIDKMVKTDDGNYPGAPFIRDPIKDGRLMIFYGPFVRKDWLDELGIESPETIDEWETMLTAFKEKKGASAPLARDGKNLIMFTEGFLVGAYKTLNDFYVDDGKILYGPIQPQYKDFLVEMNDWYAKGLIDKNFVTCERKDLDAQFLNDQTGATALYTGSGIGKLIPAFAEVKSPAKLLATKWPVLNKGDKPWYGQQDTPFMLNYNVLGVSARSKNQEVAMKFANWGYTEAGNMVYNFGVEGESYTMIDGYPTYTDKVLKPGSGLSLAQSMAQYVRCTYSGPMVQRVEYSEQYLQYPEQQEALTIWAGTDTLLHKLPPITPTSDESKEYASLKVAMDAYRDEWVVGAITGKNPIADYDKFIAEMKKMGLDRATEIQQAAFDRYNKR